MQLADHSNTSIFRHRNAYLFLFLVAVIAYWPISFQVFSVKNDAIHYFLPVRYTISNSIQHGYFPYWANSFYLGYPLHGDMQSGVWNPFVQFISLFTTYNITIFHIETLLYIFLAGAGMYKLSGIFSGSPLARLMTAISFMLSGYLLGSGEFINWLASAAFIPFLIYYYQRFLQQPHTVLALKTALCFWLLLVCGYPADTIVMAYVLAGMCVFYFVKNQGLVRSVKGLLKKYLLLHALIIVTALLLLSPALLSYFELLPYYSRGSGTGYEQAMANSFDPKSSLSFISPWAALATDFETAGDITGRNIYIGIFSLAFAVGAFFIKKSSRKTVLIVAAVVSFLFCLGNATPFRRLCYDLVPGMDTFRHPSHFRLYTIIALLLLASMTMDQWIKREQKLTPVIRNIVWVMSGLFATLVLIALFTGSSNKLPAFFSAITNREQLKIFLSSITWRELLLVCSVIQLGFLLVFIFFSKKNRVLTGKKLIALQLLNLVAMSFLALPASFVSKTSPATINKLIREKGSFYDTSAFNKTIAYNSEDALRHGNEIGLSFFYSHQPGLTRITNSPAFLSSMDDFAQSDLLYKYVRSKPVAWLSGKSLDIADTVLLRDSVEGGCVVNFSRPDLFMLPYCDSIPGKATISRIGPGRFTINADAIWPSTLNISQAYHKNWVAEVNGKQAAIETVNIAFMGVKLEKGFSEIVLRYKPHIIPYLFILSLVTLAGIIVFLILQYRKRQHI